MRYFIQLIIPALIFVGVVYLLTRQRSQSRSEDTGNASDGSDARTFLIILTLGAAVAIGTAFALQSLWE